MPFLGEEEEEEEKEEKCDDGSSGGSSDGSNAELGSATRSLLLLPTPPL